MVLVEVLQLSRIQYRAPVREHVQFKLRDKLVRRSNKVNEGNEH